MLASEQSQFFKMQSFHEARRITLKLATQFMGLDSDEDEDAVEIDDVDGVEQVWSFSRKYIQLYVSTFVHKNTGAVQKLVKRKLLDSNLVSL